MSVRRCLAAVLAGALGVAVLVTVAAPASAAPPGFALADVTIETAVVRGAVGKPVEATVSCPDGKQVGAAGISGGVLASLAPTSTRSVRGVARVRPGFDAVTIYATCMPTGLVGPTFRVEQEFPATSQLRTGTVSCPEGYIAFGGGGFYRNAYGAVTSSGTEVSSDAPTKDGRIWRFSSTNPVLGDRLVVVAQCALRTDRWHVLVLASPPPGGPATTCAHGWVGLSAGGHFTSTVNGPEVAGTLQDIFPVFIPNPADPQEYWDVRGTSTVPNALIEAVMQCILPPGVT